MKCKLLKIEYDLPETVRFVIDDYEKLSTKIRISGGNPYSIYELKKLFDDLDIVRIVTKKGNVVFFYEKEVIRFDFYPGFAYNTASVPALLKPIKDNDSLDMAIMSLPHDGGYTGHQESKEFFDKLFVDGIEWFHDNEGDEGFFENIAENIIEKGIEFAFSTDEAKKSWNQGSELSSRSGCFMKITRTPVEKSMV